MKIRFTRILAAWLLLVAAAEARASVIAQDEEFQVNGTTYRNGAYDSPRSLARGAGGEFVVVWTQSYDGDGLGLDARRFDADGTPLGADFLVNSVTSGSQVLPSVAVHDDASFVVVWMEYNGYSPSPPRDGDGFGLFGRRFDSGGSPLGTDFQINTYTTGDQTSPIAAAAPGGAFVVVWEAPGQDGDNDGIAGQRYDASGGPVGTEFAANNYTTGPQRRPAVSVAGDGSFVVVFEGDTALCDIRARRFDSGGEPIAPEFRVNAQTSISCSRPSVCSHADGGFVVVWDDGSISDDIYGQRVDSTGALAGTEFRVNTYVDDEQGYQSIACDKNGGFIVAWQDWSDFGGLIDGPDAVARRFAPDGMPDGTAFVVNTYTTDIQASPLLSVASDGLGDFVVVWSGYESAPTFYPSIFGRRYCTDDDSDGRCDGGWSCPVAGPDSDGDGVADACDPCATLDPGQRATEKVTAVLKRINADPTAGNDGLSFKAEFALPSASSFSGLDPAVNGARLTAISETDGVRVDVTVPGGAAWSSNGSATKWTYKDKAGTAGGITRVQIADRGKKSPGRVQVKTKGKNGTYPVVAGDEPLRFSVVVGAAAAGDCGETFLARDACAFNGSGTTLKCK